MDKERKMTQGTIIRKEIITHERMPDGSIRVIKTVERKVSENSDRMTSSYEVEIL